MSGWVSYSYDIRSGTSSIPGRQIPQGREKNCCHTASPSREDVRYPRRYEDQTAAAAALPTMPWVWGTILCICEAVARERKRRRAGSVRVDKTKGPAFFLLSAIPPHETVIFCFLSERPRRNDYLLAKMLVILSLFFAAVSCCFVLDIFEHQASRQGSRATATSHDTLQSQALQKRSML